MMTSVSGSPAAKTFVNGLNAVSQMWFGVNLNQTFKYKYHADHAYSQLRILHSANVANATTNAFQLNGLNVLCVACHYSNRYHNSDNYLVKYSNDIGLNESAFFLKNATSASLQSFVTPNGRQARKEGETTKFPHPRPC